MSYNKTKLKPSAQIAKQNKKKYFLNFCNNKISGATYYKSTL